MEAWWRLNWMRLVKIGQERFVRSLLKLITCVCRTTQFLYGGVFKEEKVVGVAKYDLTMEPNLGLKKLEAGGNIAGLFIHGTGKYGGEAIFVPKRPGMEGPEDDGYLICLVHDENTGY